ncbi:hypothetical protein BC829DRAFT_395361 [Chytridium lagenaria]|nr:hypothetical protein BC829DRAFT_395361 [Chytridium lagenaria]
MICSNETMKSVDGILKNRRKRVRESEDSSDLESKLNDSAPAAMPLCRNVICKACFLKEDLDWDVAKADEFWQCCHCKGSCPSRAQCKLKALRALAASRVRVDDAYDDDDSNDNDIDEDTCVICKQHGELLCCDSCPATFHINCVDLESVPETEWFCKTCQIIEREIEGNPSWRSKPVVLSLFDGIGAAYVALRRLGVAPSVYLSSEIHLTACEVLDTYAASHGGNVVQIGDITKFHPIRDLPKKLNSIKSSTTLSTWRMFRGEPSPIVDLVFLGQGAGVVDGEQSSFFFEFVRVLKETRPRWFLFENVRMRNMDMDIISRELGVEPVVVDSINLSPCRRNRLFWTNIPIRQIPKVLLDRPMITQQIILDDAIPEIEKAQCITRGNMTPHLGDSRFNVLWYPDGKRRGYHPVEIERLMGFPDFYTEGEEVRFQRHGLLGNSFSVYSIVHILGSVFAGSESAPELEWKDTKRIPKMKEYTSLIQAPRLSIGERIKVKRVLRRLQKITVSMMMEEVPDSHAMPGYLVPDFHHRYVVLVNDALNGDPPSWNTAILIPPQEYDSSMPSPRLNQVVLRCFTNGGIWAVNAWCDGSSNLRLLQPGCEPGLTMERYFPGWSMRRDVVKACEAADGGKVDVGMRWRKFRSDEGVPKGLWSGGVKLTLAVKTKNKRGSRISSTTIIPSFSTSSTPTIASIMTRLDRSIPELGSIDPDVPTHHAVSRVPEGGYVSMNEVGEDLRKTVNVLVQADENVGRMLKEVFKEEWENNEETWLEEGALVFVRKSNLIWWPAMIIPLEELDDSIPDNSWYAISVVTIKSLQPFDPSNPTGSFHQLINRFGIQSILSNLPIRKALRYVCKGYIPTGFAWSLWGCSGLYRTGPVEDDERVAKKPRLEEDGVKRCLTCGVWETVCWRNGREGFATICNDCGLRLYLEMVPRVPVTELSNERFIESQDKSKNNSKHRYYTTRRPLPFLVWDRLGGGMLDENFKLREGVTMPPRLDMDMVMGDDGDGPSEALND